MDQVSVLKQQLRPHIQWHGARLHFLCLFLLTLLKVRTVNLSELSLAFSGKAKAASSYKRLQRFFRHFEWDELSLVEVLLSILQIPEPWGISIDRTNWKFGKTNINILMLGVVYQGVAIPLLWSLLDKQGNSHTDERIDLLERFLEHFGTHQIDYIVADREFIGEDWFLYLLKYTSYRFCIRLKKNTQIGRGKAVKSAKVLFAHLKTGQTQVLKNKRCIWGHYLYVIATRLPDHSLLLLATPRKPKSALSDYANRWPIETLFGIFKSRGFRLEDTHMMAPQRLSKLLALLALALCWCLKSGEVQWDYQPLTPKKHGRLPKSLFRYGYDHLRRVCLNLESYWQEYCNAVRLLNPLPRYPKTIAII
jgi:hypothetical protein